MAAFGLLRIDYLKRASSTGFSTGDEGSFVLAMDMDSAIWGAGKCLSVGNMLTNKKFHELISRAIILRGYGNTFINDDPFLSTGVSFHHSYGGRLTAVSIDGVEA